MVDEIVVIIIGTLLTTVIASIVYRLKKLESDVDNKMSKVEVRELIQDKLDIHAYQLDAVKEDIEKIVVKLDKLLDRTR